MADYAKLKIYIAEMNKLWTEAVTVVDVVEREDAILKKIRDTVEEKVSEIDVLDDKIESAKGRMETLADEVKQKEQKITALNEYLAGGFQAQQAEMKRGVEEYIAKLKGDGEKKLEGLFSSISEKETELKEKEALLMSRSKRVDELEGRLQEIKDGILA